MAQRQIIVRRSKPKETRIQNCIIWDESISTQARFALIAMLSLPDHWDYSVRGMASMLKISKDTMGKYIKELESAGYINREQIREETGSFGRTQYIITDTKGDFGEKELPCPNLSDTDLPDPENSPQKKRTEQKIRTEEDPPKAPQRGGSARPARKKRRPKSVPSWQAERFEGFWAAYPRDEDRAKAVEEWDALPMDQELMDKHAGDEEGLLREIALGLKRHLACSDWREGRGIPYAFRWLRDRRWTEKVKQIPTGQTNCAPEARILEEEGTYLL